MPCLLYSYLKASDASKFVAVLMIDNTVGSNVSIGGFEAKNYFVAAYRSATHAPSYRQRAKLNKGSKSI